ncbi:MAG: LPS assembly protein LptD [Chakrabartia sp.]
MTLSRSIFLVSFPLALGVANPVFAQSADVVVDAKQEVAFTSDQLDYDSNADVVTASGDVRMSRDGNRLRADKIVWNRKSGEVNASGNVMVTNSSGDIAYGDSIALTDTLRDGVVENLLIVLKDGGRLVAVKGTRNNEISRLDRAAYTPCKVVDDKGCPKDPVWKISAVSVVHDPNRNRISYKGARLELFGLPILALPGLSHPADDRGGSGFLVPDLKITQTNGLEFSAPFYVLLDRNQDLTLTPHVYSSALPALEAKYRALTRKGAYQIGGFATYGSRIPTLTAGTPQQRDFRGYLEASGKLQLDPRWSVTGSLRAVTDRTFLRRYDISRDDRLRSVLDIERVTRTSYFSFSNWAFQTLRSGDAQGQIPLALPVFDYRKRTTDPLVGGRVEFQLNSMALARTSGQDTQRAFAGARWDVRRITGLGQEVMLTGYARADVYHSDEVNKTSTVAYRGTTGWNGRFISAAAAEIRWPFIGKFLGGTQRLTPRLQIVASPGTPNLRVPNEDARAVDLEDSNLFALNRFAGYDRWEDGTRATYGLDWALDAPGFRMEANIGQSYRLSSKSTLFPDGTGLSSRTSDIVGRTSIKFKKLVSLTHRYRLDKDSLAIRRNEFDATVGTAKTYGTVGYLRLNRDIGPQLEDLRDREEVRLGGRVQVSKFWSLFGSTIIDLTDRAEDPFSLADGYEPVRHRVGIAYEDDCLTLGLTWRRDYDASGDAKRGNTFQLRLSLRNLGR